MNLKDSINRGYNLLSTSIVGLAGFAFLPEIFLEKDWDDKLDDIGLLAVAIAGIIWYLTKNNKYQRSFMPIVFVTLSLIAKIAAITVEFKDKESVGDDFGGLILFILATGLIVYQYSKTQKLLRSPQ